MSLLGHFGVDAPESLLSHFRCPEIIWGSGGVQSTDYGLRLHLWARSELIDNTVTPLGGSQENSHGSPEPTAVTALNSGGIITTGINDRTGSCLSLFVKRCPWCRQHLL